MSVAMDPAKRKRVLMVVFFSLLLDLISFTFILPLFPKLLEFYRNLETSTTLSPSSTAAPTILARTLALLNAYKNAFSRTIDSRYDIVLLGGALGSLFSLLQALASPIIGRLSDTHGRRPALLVSMLGNILSVLLWVAATDFRTFLLSRVVGGLSEGNVQIATAIAADVSTPEQRGATMALVGACFCVAFTFGPALGAWLSTRAVVAENPFRTAAAFSLGLVVVETVFLYFALPETLPSKVALLADRSEKALAEDNVKTLVAGEEKALAAANGKPPAAAAAAAPSSSSPPASQPAAAATATTAITRTNSHAALNLTHFAFVLFFSGIEFSLPFLTHELFGYDAARNGRLLGYMGLVASLLQGGATRRLPPLASVRLGVLACLASFALLARARSERALYAAATALAVTTATVVTGLSALSSFEAAENERGRKLGGLRSWGQVGRALGPLTFCSLYWWAGRETAFTIGGTGMALVTALVFMALKTPRGT